MSKIKIGLVQYSPEWEDADSSIKIIDTLLEKYNLRNVELLVFPEMALTGFTMKSKLFAEDMDGISFIYFMNLARKFKTNIFAGLVEKDEDRIYNSLIHFNEKGLIMNRYRKIHPFSNSGENKNYKSGRIPVVTKIGKIKIGLSICYDLRFPELYRHYGKEKVDILCNIANWPNDRINHWDKFLQARAIENLSYMIGINRVGSDPKLKYSGHSMVVAPMGDTLIQSEVEEIIFFEIDTDLVDQTREKLPFLNDIKLI